MCRRMLLLATLSCLTRTIAAQRVSFTRAQAEQGSALYARHCAQCHGPELVGGNASPLAGPQFHARWAQATRTLDDLFYVMRTSMPFGAGGTLTTDEYVAILAHMLARNGHEAGARALVADRTVLAAARIASASAATPASTPFRFPNPAYMVGAGGATPMAVGPTHDELRAGSPDGRNWLTATRDYAGTRYSPLEEITTANAGRLRVACSFQVGEAQSFQTNPIVRDGTMYLTVGWSTMAIDAATCRPKWRHDWRAAFPNPPATRGVAIKDGRVVRLTGDGYILALDAANGRLLWARRVADPTKGEMFTMPPIVYDDLIIAGPAVSEYAIRGWVAAFRLADGERVWRFNIVPEPGEPGAETWKQPKDLPVGGGAVWTPVSIDPAREIVYVPAANPAPDFPAAIRGGTNLYTNSVIALNIRTGKLAWYDQLVPEDDHDWDLTQVSPLYRATAKGKVRDLVATAGKDGVLRVIDRESKERIFETPVTTIENAEAPVTTSGTRACPGVLGGVQWNGPAYAPTANVLVTPAVDWCSTFFLADTVKFVPFQNYMGGRVVSDSLQRGWLTAADASTGAVKWRYRSSQPMIAAVTATAGNVIFAGELTGDFIALDAATGAERFRHNTGGPIGGGIATYSVGARQYVAVASGRPSGFWTKAFPGSATITVFALDGGR
jgi:alcohol dehydrogenase (cytochrome c)